uniref:C-type lectin domain-containing protein n=1 Tax=Timema genevievae TaxID=629358 RepID=A0A7R9K694_TIMGE|nr:unnamed protein product [Timema genevievae]
MDWEQDMNVKLISELEKRQSPVARNHSVIDNRLSGGITGLKLLPLESSTMFIVSAILLACLALASSAPSAKELKWVKSSPGYEYFSGAGFYKFYDQRVTWGEAWATCINDGTHLMTIDSEKEAEVVKELFGRYIKNYSSTQNIAVGFHDLYKKDVFTSINDDLLEFQNWAPGEPNNFEGKERCGGAYITAKFNDISCDSLNPFICEYKS